MAKRFLSLLKKERMYRTVYATQKQARSEIIRDIEGL
jgi:hypothetical protein